MTSLRWPNNAELRRFQTMQIRIKWSENQVLPQKLFYIYKICTPLYLRSEKWRKKSVSRKNFHEVDWEKSRPALAWIDSAIVWQWLIVPLYGNNLFIHLYSQTKWVENNWLWKVKNCGFKLISKILFSNLLFWIRRKVLIYQKGRGYFDQFLQATPPRQIL